MKEKLTQEQLQEKIMRLKDEIPRLENFIKSSDTTAFEIMIDDIKEDMRDNITEEDWKSLKANRCKIEGIRSVSKIIQNQSALLDQKEDELEKAEWELSHYQLGLFDDSSEKQPEYTGYMKDGNEIRLGDVFSPAENLYLLVKKSAEIEGKYALCSNFFEDERMLQYPANLGLLDDTDYVGNIYDESDNELALTALKAIGEYLNTEPEKDNNGTPDS